MTKRVWLCAISILVLSTFACKRTKPFTYVVDYRFQPRHTALPGLKHGPTRPVGMAIGPDGKRDKFVSNEVILRSVSQEDLQAFLVKYAGTVLDDGTPLVIRGGRRLSDAEPVSSGSYLVRVNLDRAPINDLSRTMEAAGLRGHFVFSSDDAARLIAIVGSEAKRHVSPNFVMDDQCDVCEHPDGVGGNLDAATWPWMTEDDDPMTPGDQGLSVGVIHAWEYLRYLGIPPTSGGTWQPALVAIVDGGFDLDESTGVPLNGNRDYFFFGNAPMQGDVIDHDGTAGGPNPGDCGDGCAWHGQSVFGVAAARPRNNFGSAGTGGDAVLPLLIITDDSFYVRSLAVRSAAYNGASVINISYGGTCNWLCRTFIDGQLTLQSEIGFADQSGAIIVAAAMNDREDISDENVIPCKLNRVICVGSIDQNKRNVYNYGNGVHIWAPTCIFSTVNRESAAGDSDSVGADELDTFCGTSASTPFISGIVGLMKALNPALTYDEVKSILQGTANPSPDPRVRFGYVDAYRAVQGVRPNRPPTMSITSPRDGSSISPGATPYFRADVIDPESPDIFRGTVMFSSNRDGLLCSGNGCVGPRLSRGIHIITATASDLFGGTASASITVNVINQAPSATITYPPSGTIYFSSQAETFRGFGFDPDEVLPDTSLAWRSSIDGNLGTGRLINRVLSAGSHTITLTATDSFGLSGQQTINIVVRRGSGFPTAMIFSPSDGALFPVGMPITFQGQGLDPQQGVLPDSRLTWTSSRDGVLGTGNTIQPVLSGPADSCNPEYVFHTITLTVTDSQGHTGTYQIRVGIGRVC